jgi:hypothetical protein
MQHRKDLIAFTVDDSLKRRRLRPNSKGAALELPTRFGHPMTR